MRVATSPDVATQLQKLGFTVAIEAGAGRNANFEDEAYRKAGVTIVEDPASLWASSDIILKVRAPERHPALSKDEVDLLRPGQILIAFLWPAQNPDLLKRLAEKGVTALAMDSVPRISRAQKMDALSSMANIAGYRAVIEAAEHFGRFFTGQITAAGRIPPAKVLVIGAGVAGLSAIGTAKGLGAIVHAFDTRPEVKDQVESMGGEFLDLDYKEEGAGVGGYAKVMSPAFIKAEMELFAKQAAEVDIIITTALIPGKPAPKLVTAETARLMKTGSVIVDLAAEQGGNCELTEPGKVVKKDGVTIIGYMDMPSRLPTQASQLYATNLKHLLSDMCPKKDGNVVVDFNDEVVRGATVVKDGQITWPPPASAPTGATAGKPAAAGSQDPVSVTPAGSKDPASIRGTLIAAGLGALSLYFVGAYAPAEFLQHFTVFVLACFVGYMVVWNVTPALHTPLMSVTNAISSIIIIGGLIQISDSDPVVMWIAGLTITLTAINIAGGFAVTQRMLGMFRK
jgi:NAD(P) transhydrogenase subunit alpha